MKHHLILCLWVLGLMSCQSNAKDNIKNTEKSTSTEAQYSPQSGYAIGDTATDFALKNVDGNMVSLADYTDAKGYIVIFTCNHCPYSLAYEDRIIEINKRYAPQGYPVIAINPNDPAVQAKDSYELMQERAQEKGFDFPYLFDDGQKIYPQYGATRTPHVFVLQKDGKQNLVRYIGAIDNDYEDAESATEHYVDDAVDALLAGKPVPLTETKAVGCSIKAQ